MAEFCEHRSTQTAPIKNVGLLIISLSKCKILNKSCAEEMNSFVNTFIYLLAEDTCVTGTGPPQCGKFLLFFGQTVELFG
jgi:hypothetical protein